VQGAVDLSKTDRVIMMMMMMMLSVTCSNTDRYVRHYIKASLLCIICMKMVILS
jgi:hypothetical protein